MLTLFFSNLLIFVRLFLTVTGKQTRHFGTLAHEIFFVIHEGTAWLEECLVSADLEQMKFVICLSPFCINNLFEMGIMT